ncbi:MAG: hypothetical protein U0703_27910 [Anaerolineae bacterium]
MGYLLSANVPPDDVIVVHDSDPTGVGHSRFESAWLYLGIGVLGWRTPPPSSPMPRVSTGC